ncbi:MAG TPA: ATP-binding protein [Pirellulales bacterium]|jgi:PAS domain S-box-containing protein|nr:ATP-binding protein [Pirellulales bacterium]
MSDRRRLLALSVLILAAVSLAAIAVTAYHLSPEAGKAVQRPMAESLRFAVGSTAVVVFAAATLLLRVIQPFIRRLQESEAQTRAIVETAVDGLITTDERGMVRSFNPAAQRLFRYSAAEFIGRSMALVIQPCEPATNPGLFNAGRSIADGQMVTSGVEAIGRRRDGTTFPVELSIGEHIQAEQPMRITVVRDITDRKQAQLRTLADMENLQALTESLEAKAAELARVNQELNDFTYIASHDLKEPLRGISSYCAILLEEYQDRLDDNGRRTMGTLVVLCQRLDRLIDDLLTYSRAGREPDFADTELDEVLDGVLDRLGPAIDARGGVVRRLDVLPRVVADPTLMGLVLSNLISNGLKFNEHDPPLVEIGCLEGAPLTIFVRDDGIGIAEKYHEEVFAMFRRLQGQKKYEGTGAGLSIVRRIVERHGGRIWLESSLGSGSTFFFTLPPARHAARRPLRREPACAAQEA